MNPPVARGLTALLLVAGFAAVTWQLMASAPESKRERPPVPTPLLDVIATEPAEFPLRLAASGPVISAAELEVRPQVGGRLVALHPEFEPGGRIPAGADLFEIETEEYQLEVDSANAEIAKAQAAIALEQGRRVVAREELSSLRGSLEIDATSQALALRKPQLRQVQAELTAAQNRLQGAMLDLERTRMSLPFDAIVLERARVAGEVVAARELIGRITRADRYWVDLRLPPERLRRIRARNGTTPGSEVVIHDNGIRYRGEVLRKRADLATGSRLGGVIATIPLPAGKAPSLLLGRYVEAEIDGGTLPDVIRVPRRALRENDRIWVVDGDAKLQVREAATSWESGQSLLLHKDSVEPGDLIVVSRITGLVPGTTVRARQIDPVVDPLTVGSTEPGDDGR